MCNISLALCLSAILIYAQATISNLLTNSTYEFTYTSTTTASYVNFQLYLTPIYSAGLLIGKNAPFNVSVHRQDWIHFYHLSQNNCDYEGMVTGRNQYAFAKNKGMGTTIYFKLINFEPDSSFYYTINITEANFYLQSCPSGLIKQTNGQYCQFCDFGHIGVYCSISRHSINPASQYTLVLTPFSYNYFTLQTQSEISLSLIFDNGIILFLQTQTFADELPGITNYRPESGGQGKFFYSSGASISMDLSASGGHLLVGVINPHANSVGFSILFNEKSGVNVIVIIIGVMGGIIFLGLVISAIIILRKLHRSRREVLPQSSGQSLERSRSNKLSQEEINFYFPELPLKAIHPQLYNEIAYQKELKLESAEKIECVICLCSIQGEDMVRAGFCKHILHSVCLIQWFKKQQNCPYCRYNFERQSTKQQYKKLVLKTGKKLKGQEIVKSIFAKNDQLTLYTINITDISGEAFDE